MAIKKMEPIRMTEAMKQDLLDMAGNITMLKEEIAKAKRAEMDVADLEEKFNKMIRLREGLLREYV